MNVRWKWVALAAAAPFVYNLDAIHGQWKFDRMCKQEGGPRFYAAVEKDVGWRVDNNDKYSYQWPFMFGPVAFVRYQDARGLQSDVKAEGYVAAGERKYIFSRVDESHAIRYIFRHERVRIADDDRFTKTQFQVIEAESGTVAAKYTQFNYHWTKPERVLLGAPTGVGCWDTDSEFRTFYSGLFNYNVERK
ncbi:hypothetical protein LOC51_33795 [Rubrivivax sp. JA1024]|nr:hypothetical protein [Rubrivivax sp. JA1024]